MKYLQMKDRPLVGIAWKSRRMDGGKTDMWLAYELIISETEWWVLSSLLYYSLYI